MKALKEGMEVQITVPARIVEIDGQGENARLALSIDTETQWFDTACLEPLQEVLEKRRQVKGVFEAANAIDAGRLPKRADAVEYIRYLQGCLHFMGNKLLERERELEAFGWKMPGWSTAWNGAEWILVSGETPKEEGACEPAGE